MCASKIYQKIYVTETNDWFEESFVTEKMHVYIYIYIYMCIHPWICMFFFAPYIHHTLPATHQDCCQLKEPCREIINFAKAEWKDVCEAGTRSGLCPVLTALRNTNPKRSDTRAFFSIFFMHWHVYACMISVHVSGMCIFMFVCTCMRTGMCITCGFFWFSVET